MRKNEKNNNRRSWFGSTNIFNMFSSAPTSPELKNKKSIESIEIKQRSYSLTPLEDSTSSETTLPKRPTQLLKRRPKSSFTSFLSKNKKKKNNYSHPSIIDQSSDSSILFDTPSTRRNSFKSDSRTLSSNHSLIMNYTTKYSNSSQFFKMDEGEADRIQLKNDLVKLAFDGEFELPFDYKDLNNGRILDVGCGPGAWCIDLALKYPKIKVIGIDVDNIFPSEINLPDNCQLVVCNVLNGLREFPDSSFDVIQVRFMALSFTLLQYPKVIQDCYRLLKPGGYIQILETDLIVYSPGPIMNKFNEQMSQVAIHKGFNPRKQTESLYELIPKDAIQSELKYRSIPIGVWGGRLGVLSRDDLINILNKFRPHIQAEMGYNEDFDLQLLSSLKELDKFKCFSNYYFLSFQKPKQTLQRQYYSSTNSKLT